MSSCIYAQHFTKVTKKMKCKKKLRESVRAFAACASDILRYNMATPVLLVDICHVDPAIYK